MGVEGKEVMRSYLVREGIEEQKNRYLKVVGEADDKEEKDNGERR